LASGAALRPSVIQPAFHRLEDLARANRNRGRPRPFVAGLLSAVVPGAGRVYSGRTAEGIYSFILFSLAAWQSIDGFHDDGRESIKGWTAGSIGIVLYAGNVYVSFATAKKVRAARMREVMDEVDQILDRRLNR
jgi:hypothetical protein